MVYDSKNKQVVLFGRLEEGYKKHNDTWVWDGKKWKEIKGPGKRNGHVMTYDPERKRVILYGGGYYDGKVSKSYDDTWSWEGENVSNFKISVPGSLKTFS